MKKFIKNLDKREKILIILFLAVMVIVIYYNYFYLPFRREIEVLTEERNHLQENIRSLNKLPDLIPVLKNNYQLIKKELSNSKLNQNREIIVSEIKEMIVSEEIKLKTYNTQYDKDKLYLQIRTSGEYESIKKILSELEKWKKQLDFKQLEIKSSKDQQLELDLLLFINDIEADLKKINNLNESDKSIHSRNESIIGENYDQYLNIKNLFKKEQSEINTQEIYIYNEKVNNPFIKRLSEDQKQNKLAEIESDIPFNLKGILLGKDLKLALIKKENSVKIIKTGDKIDNYTIINIDQDRLIIEYKDSLFEMGPEGVEWH